ncbi:MAG: Ig-like domain-containing protein [Abditibacteriota bacterium]|nr:Ig-like domain-containing protein [Abditibacteriota bacterium]
MYTSFAKFLKPGALAALLFLLLAGCICAEEYDSLTIQLSADDDTTVYSPTVNANNSHGVIVKGNPAPVIYNIIEDYNNLYRRYYQYDLNFAPSGIVNGNIFVSGRNTSGIYFQEGFPCSFNCLIDDNSSDVIQIDPQRCFTIKNTNINKYGDYGDGIVADCFYAENTNVQTFGNYSYAVSGSGFSIFGGKYYTEGIGAHCVDVFAEAQKKYTFKVFDSGKYDNNGNFKIESERSLTAKYAYGNCSKSEIKNAVLESKQGYAVNLRSNGLLNLIDCEVLGGIAISGGAQLFIDNCKVIKDNDYAINFGPSDCNLIIYNCDLDLGVIGASGAGGSSSSSAYSHYIELRNSDLKFSIPSYNTSYSRTPTFFSVKIDVDSLWVLSGDTYLSSIDNEGNVLLNGYTLYIKGKEFKSPSSITLNKTSLSLETGKSEQLTPAVTPDNAFNKGVTWLSYDESIATVDADGNVKGVAPGATTIRVKTKDGGFTAKCKVKVADPKVPVIGVALNKTSLTLTTGKSETLLATVSPSGATNKALTWTSYDTSIATVSAAGVVKGIKPGTTTIRVKTKDGGYTAKCKVKVQDPKIAVNGVKINKTSVSLEKGKTLTLTATVAPSNATDKTVTWTSYDTSIATVTSAGVVKGVKAGTTTIRAKTKDGGFTVKCKVKVQ